MAKDETKAPHTSAPKGVDAAIRAALDQCDLVERAATGELEPHVQELRRRLQHAAGEAKAAKSGS